MLAIDDCHTVLAGQPSLATHVYQMTDAGFGQICCTMTSSSFTRSLVSARMVLLSLSASDHLDCRTMLPGLGPAAAIALQGIY